jgi:hypothetical protein
MIAGSSLVSWRARGLTVSWFQRQILLQFSPNRVASLSLDYDRIGPRGGDTWRVWRTHSRFSRAVGREGKKIIERAIFLLFTKRHCSLQCGKTVSHHRYSGQRFSRQPNVYIWSYPRVFSIFKHPNHNSTRLPNPLHSLQNPSETIGILTPNTATKFTRKLGYC